MMHRFDHARWNIQGMPLLKQSHHSKTQMIRHQLWVLTYTSQIHNNTHSWTKVHCYHSYAWTGHTTSYWRLGTKLYLPKHSRRSGPRFNIRMSFYQYRKSHCGDKTVVRSSYLHNGISYTGKMLSLYWISPQIVIIYANFIITGSNGGCYKGNFHCHPWQQSWHHNNSESSASWTWNWKCEKWKANSSVINSWTAARTQ